MRERQHHKNKLTQGQVSHQTAATKMAVKFDLVRVEQNVTAEIDSFTHGRLAQIQAYMYRVKHPKNN